MTGTDWTTCTHREKKGSKKTFKKSQERRIRKSKETLEPSQLPLKTSERTTEECDETEVPTGVDADRWTVRHAACVSASLRGWRSMGVHPRSVGVRTDPGEAGACSTAVPVSMPV